MLLQIVLPIAIIFGIIVFTPSTIILVLNIRIGFSLFLAFTLDGTLSFCLVIFLAVSLPWCLPNRLPRHLPRSLPAIM